MTNVRLHTRHKLSSGDWNPLQVLANERQMRLSLGSTFLMANFDSVRLLNESVQAVHIGGFPFK